MFLYIKSIKIFFSNDQNSIFKQDEVFLNIFSKLLI